MPGCSEIGRGAAVPARNVESRPPYCVCPPTGAPGGSSRSPDCSWALIKVSKRWRSSGLPAHASFRNLARSASVAFSRAAMKIDSSFMDGSLPGIEGSCKRQSSTRKSHANGPRPLACWCKGGRGRLEIETALRDCETPRLSESALALGSCGHSPSQDRPRSWSFRPRTSLAHRCHSCWRYCR